MQTFLGSSKYFSQWTNSPPFTEPEISLSCSQDFATGSYSVRWIQSTTPHTVSLMFILTLSSNLHLCIEPGLFHSGFPTIYSAFLISRRHSTPIAHPNIHDLITLIIFLKSKNDETPHYAVFFSLPPLPPS